jgi:hypothetical protein
VLNLDRARAARGGLYTMYVMRDGLPLLALPIPGGDSFEFSLPAIAAPARYELWVERLAAGVSVEAVSSPIWVDPAGDPEDDGGPGPEPPPEPPASCTEAARVALTSGDDSFFGTAEIDRIHGRRGADRLRGDGGDDCIYGGRGRDRVNGGPGEDLLIGGGHSDRIFARDGERDVVFCGTGRSDRAQLDRLDRARKCERVRRR